MQTSTTQSVFESCPYCGNVHGKRCPAVKAIEYYENGQVKRVEFVDNQASHISWSEGALSSGTAVYPANTQWNFTA